MYDSTLNQGFMLHHVDDTTWVFRPSKKGLFFSDVKNDIARVFINTVETIKSKHTIKEYSCSVRVHSLQDIICWPNTNDFIKYIERNLNPIAQ